MQESKQGSGTAAAYRGMPAGERRAAGGGLLALVLLGYGGLAAAQAQPTPVQTLTQDQQNSALIAQYGQSQGVPGTDLAGGAIGSAAGFGASGPGMGPALGGDLAVAPVNASEAPQFTVAGAAEAKAGFDAARDGRALPARPGEFELYVKRRLGQALPRFGASLLMPSARDFAVPATSTIPGSYELNPGDLLSVHLLGAIQFNADLEIDSDGTVFIPNVGRVALAGSRYDQLPGVLKKAVGKRFKNFDTTVGIRKLAGIKVYVTGFANRPGSYSMNSLSTLVNATFAAGGPSAGGSFRSVRLYRKGTLVSDFDLYDLLRGGDRTRDALLQNEDVLYIPPVGAQIAIAGSVNAEAIYEAKPGETLGQLIEQDAGGFNSLADPERVMLYRVTDLDKLGSQELSKAAAATVAVQPGDIVRVLSIGATRRPVENQAVLVRLEGEVVRPGEYYVAPNTTFGEVLRQAGGLTPRAFVYGTRFERVSVREQQRESFLEAVDQLEISLAGAPLAGQGGAEAQHRAAREVVERMKQREPDGRVVLQLSYEAQALPEGMTLENNDRIYVPARPTTVGVFGAVFRAGSFELAGGAKVQAYVELAGGAQSIADKKTIFVVHANGAVESAKSGVLKARALPGDLVFVPVKTYHPSFLNQANSISALVANFGIAIAAIHAVFP